MVINLNWVIIELAFVLATALLGFMIGWKYMAIWTVGVFFSTIVASKIGPRLVLLLNKMLSVGAQLLGITLNGSETSVKAPSISVPDSQLPLLVAAFFLFLVFFAYWVARRLGNSIDVGLLGKIMGAIFGGLGALIALSEVSNYYNDFVARNGSDPLAGTLSLNPSLTIGVGAGDLAGYGTMAMALFLILLVIYVIWRVARRTIFS